MRPSHLILSLFFAVFCTAAAYAMNRPLPIDAQFGLFSPSASPDIVIDGKPSHLTAGAQIRDTNNRLVLPQSLGGLDVPILYQKSNSEQIHRIWILTKEEADTYSSTTPSPVLPNRTPRQSNGPIQIK